MEPQNGKKEPRQFKFITSSTASVPSDSATRSLIKRQAMKDVVDNRRQSQHHNKTNVGQFPVVHEKAPNHCLRSTTSSAVVSSCPTTRVTSNHASFLHRQKNGWRTRRRSHARLTPSPVISPAPPCHETALSPLLRLTPLVGLRLGINSIFRFSQDFTKAGGNFLQPNPGRSFLSFVLCRYDHCRTVKHATDSIILRLQMLTTNYEQRHYIRKEMYRSYTQALRCLQNAINDQNQCLLPETLCAVEILGIFELLNASGNHAWLEHAAGAAQLIQHRGTERLTTKFEKAMFLGHVGAIVTCCILRRTSCFLVQEPWQQVFGKLVRTSEVWTDRSGIAIRLWKNLVTAPEMYNRTEDLVFAGDPLAWEHRNMLIDKINHSRMGLLNWRDAYLRVIKSANLIWKMREDSSLEPDAPQDHRQQLEDTFLACFLLKSRLQVALAPHRFAQLERQTQLMAKNIIRQQESTSPQFNELHGRLFLAQAGWIARAVQQTADIYTQAAQIEGDGPIAKDTFIHWSECLGRKSRT